MGCNYIGGSQIFAIFGCATYSVKYLQLLRGLGTLLQLEDIRGAVGAENDAVGVDWVAKFSGLRCHSAGGATSLVGYSVGGASSLV